MSILTSEPHHPSIILSFVLLLMFGVSPHKSLFLGNKNQHRNWNLGSCTVCSCSCPPQPQPQRGQEPSFPIHRSAAEKQDQLWLCGVYSHVPGVSAGGSILRIRVKDARSLLAASHPCDSVCPLLSPRNEKQQGERMHFFTCCSEIFTFEGRRRMLLFGFTKRVSIPGWCG